MAEKDLPDLAAVADALSDWYDAHARDLPWRGDVTPYETLVSEVMLQQTRVETVRDYYAAFLDRFPTVEALAEAPEDDVLSVWAGLGYYRRARHLNAAAKRIVEDHDGQVPDTREELLDLPGIGPYTAGAVLSIAFGRAEPALDANAKRVLARLTGETERVDRAAAQRRLAAAAGLLLAAGEPSELTQALMELGALVCRTDPRCGACPLAGTCRARTQGIEHEIPRTKEPTPPKEVPVALLVVRRGGEVLLAKAPDDGLLAGTWGFPWAEFGGDPAKAARRRAAELGVEASVEGLLARYDHVFSHRRWDVHALRLTGDGGGEATRWVPVDELDPGTLPAVHREAARAVGSDVQAVL